MDAIIYARWSSLEQGRAGTSTLSRQLSFNEAFAERAGHTVVERIVDEGRSAWTGDNIKTGNLGKLTERLEREGGEGRVILVEKLDRLSRQSPIVMMTWLQRICATGVTIASADGRHTITTHDLMSNMMGVLSIVFDAFRGFDESQVKSVRVGEAWRQKRERGAPMTKLCPAWMRLRDDRTAYELIEDRAAIVRRIFAMTEAGIGKYSIAATFNDEGVPVFGRGQGWHASYIQKITRSIAAVGSFQPCRRAKADERQIPDGDPIHGYFPAVVSEDVWARGQRPPEREALVATARRTLPSQLVRRFGEVRVRRHHDLPLQRPCGTRRCVMVREDYLVCDNALRKRGCENRTHWNYEAIETGMLDTLLHSVLDDSFFRSPDLTAGLEAEIAMHRRRLSDDERRSGEGLCDGVGR